MGKSMPKPPEKQVRVRATTVCARLDNDRNLKRNSRRISDEIASSSEPVAKKNRLDAKNTENSEEEGTRRRRTLKHGEIAPPQCTFCKEEQKSEDEPLKECSTCKAKYHLQKCLRYKNELLRNITNNEEWQCARCITCTACDGYVDDASNVECTNCCRAWHGYCAPRGHCPLEEFDSDWYCSHCCRKLNFRIIQTPISPRIQRSDPPASLFSKKRKVRGAPKDQLEFLGNVDELKDLINKRDFTWEYLNFEAGFSSKKPDLPVLSRQNAGTSSSKSQNSRRKSSKKTEDGFDYLSVKEGESIPKVVKNDEDLFESSKSSAYPSTSQPSSSTSATSSSSTSPPPTTSSPQWLHFGAGKSCKTIYRSAFEEPLLSSPNLFACKFCLHTTHQKADFIVHWKNCQAKNPPGNEIYRNEGVSFFEVDGAAQKKYCQDLCLLSKLFIASKTLYDEVETFIFYILCEITTEGFIIVGYFSKEKNPSKNNNLSCLLVLPMVQKMGYGRLLIDMSYELSRKELRIGHPEHPLSDLGILAYRGYWRSSLLCYLRKHRNSDKINIKDMCLSTRIAPIDIVNQLMLDNMIVLKRGVYSIKIGKRALKFPLSMSRRRFVERSKLIWQPRTSVEKLDPTKINTYV